MKKIFSVFLALIVVAGCKTTSKDPKDIGEPPEIVASMPLQDALEAAIRHGGATIDKVRRLVAQRQEWPLAVKLLEQGVVDGITKYENNELINAVYIYQSAPSLLKERLFIQLISSGRPLARQLGWQLAAAKANKDVGVWVERELTRALAQNEEDQILIPQVAMAVQQNRLVNSYTLMRQGLFVTGEDVFAKAMQTLNPAQASADFLDYIALAPIEELRQMTLVSINVYSVTLALQHLVKNPAPMAHGKIDHLFFYATSRNTSLAELANLVLDNYIASDKAYMAQVLARMPTWVQVAYIESVRRTPSATKTVFLAELKRLSPQAEVIEEINEIRL